MGSKPIRPHSLGLSIGLAVVGMLFGSSVVWPALWPNTHGFPTYYVSARLMFDGRWNSRVYENTWFSAQVQDITQGRVSEIFAPNPPPAAFWILPLVWLDLPTARIVWIALNALALAVVGWGALKNESWALRFDTGWVWMPLALLFYAPLRETFRLGQVYVALLSLFALAFWALTKPSPIVAGIALGMAAGLKLSGLPLLAWLAFRGWWLVFWSAAVTAAAIGLFSVWLVGGESWLRFGGSVIEHLRSHPQAAVTAFQTTPSFFQHLWVADPVWNPQPVAHWPWAAPLTSLGLTAAAFGWTLWKSRRVKWEVTFAALMVLSVICFPLAEEYHYTLLLLPVLVAARCLRQQCWPLGLTLWFGLSLFLLACPWDYKQPAWFDGWRALLAYPRLYGGWLLWAWLVWRND